jgi:hypothetical protein
MDKNSSLRKNNAEFYAGGEKTDGVVTVESNHDLRSELQELRKAIVHDIAMELQHSNRKTPRHRTDPRKQAIAKLIQKTPKMNTLQLCFEMDKLQEKSAAYAPLPAWKCRL